MPFHTLGAVLDAHRPFSCCYRPPLVGSVQPFDDLLPFGHKSTIILDNPGALLKLPKALQKPKDCESINAKPLGKLTSIILFLFFFIVFIYVSGKKAFRAQCLFSAIVTTLVLTFYSCIIIIAPTSKSIAIIVIKV